MSSASVNPQQQHPSATSSSSTSSSSSSAVPSSSSVTVKRSLQHCSTGSPVSCQLADAELWRRFHEVGNEMIVTKAGRRMFPVIAVSIQGLDPDALYSICVEFHPADDNRYKYVGGQWVIAAKSQLHDVPVPTYWHPEIPNFGSHWMGGSVSFGKLKLTNKDKLDKSQVSLVTLHLYQPTIRIIRVAGQNERFTVATFTFPETRFMAVTSYQNEDVTSLKVRYNPFAQKVFQDMAKGRSCGTGGGSSSNGRDDDGDDEPDLSPSSVDNHHQQQRTSATSKMMKGASGAIPTASVSSYSHSQVSPPQQQQQQQQQQQLAHRQPAAAQQAQRHHSVVGGGVNSNLLLMDPNLGAGMSAQDFAFNMGSGFQQPRYNFATPAIDQFGGGDINGSSAFFSSYANPIHLPTNAYQPQMPSVGSCFSSTIPPSIATSASSCSSAAAAAAAYAASYSNMLSSTLPPVAHSSVMNTAPTFWPGFVYHQSGATAVTAPTFQQQHSAATSQHSTLTMLNKSSDSISSNTPSTPSGPGSNTAANTTSSSSSGNSSAGSRSMPLSLMRLGVNVTGGSSSSSSSTATPTSSLQSLTNRSSDALSATGGISASLLAAGVLKASPPESGYCGSPPIGEEWTACAYQQIGSGGQRPNSSNNAPVCTISSMTSSGNATSTNNASY